MNITNLKKIFLATLIFSSFALVGCQDDGPAENFGEQVDEAVDDSRNALEEAGDDIEDAADDTGDAIKDATN